MKNIEEKAKAYDEALERAKQIRNGNPSSGTAIVVCEEIFPELAESEDERIRKYLIEELKAAKSVGELKFAIPQPTREECISYLERQKEQKPIEFKNDELVEIIKGEFEGFRTLLKKKGIDYEPQRSYWEGFARLFDSSAREYVKEQKRCKDSGTDGDIMQYIEEGEKRGIKEVISFPEKYGLQKKQKPTSFNEPYNPDEYEVVMEGNATSLKRKEQKQEIISISEMVSKYRNTDEYYDDGNYKGKPLNCMIRAYEQGIRDTLSKVKEQKPAWSEEDKLTVDAAIYWLEERLRIERADDISTECSPLSMRKTAERLKSLRPRPSWKPSEEQIAALKWQVEHPELVKWRKGDLESLLEQLKKL